MKDFLQGKWLGHPLHPLLVHVPTALWPAAMVFDILANGGVGGNVMVQTSFWAILVGLVVALGAVPAGVADWLDIRPEKAAKKIGLYHMGINGTVAALQAINLWVRWDSVGEAASAPAAGLVLSVVSVLLLFVSGYLGGMMVYDYGIGIARVSKGKWRKIADAGGARVPEEKGGDA